MKELGYEESLAHDRDRERQRDDMNALVAYFEGADTPEARRVGKVFEEIRRKRLTSDLAGDPLRLRPEHQRIKQAEEKAKNQKRKKGLIGPETQGVDIRDERVVDPFGDWKMVKSRGFSTRGFEDFQTEAARRFETDWERAYGDSLKVSALQPKVDGGGGASRAHIARLDAQERLSKLQAKLGERDYRVLEATVVYGIKPAQIEKKGGPTYRAVRNDIARILVLVAGFYGSIVPKRDKTIEVIDQLIAAAHRSLESGDERQVMEIERRLR